MGYPPAFFVVYLIFYLIILYKFKKTKMKKLTFILAVAIMMAVTFVACNKKSDDVMKPEKQYVNVIAGSFVAHEGDITLKSADLTKVTRTWTMYTNNPAFYTPNYWSLVNGREFITGSAAYNFWSNSANNPVSFDVSQDGSVYSNLTPDESLRCVLETKNSNHEVVYLGIVDFDPTTASFPMTVNGFRLGDKLTINADKLFNLPGGDRISITAAFNLSPVKLSETELGPITGTSTAPDGKQFQWSDVVYGTPVAQSVAVTKTNGTPIELYDGLASKVFGSVTITVTDNGSAKTGPTGGYIVTIDLNSIAGKGHALTLNTSKIGWYDSDFIQFNETDITVTDISVDVN